MKMWWLVIPISYSANYLCLQILLTVMECFQAFLARNRLVLYPLCLKCNISFPSNIQFGFWYVGDDGHSQNLPHKHPEKLQPRPGRSLASTPRANDILHLRLLKTLNNMAEERYRVQKRSRVGMKPKFAFIFKN